MATYDYECTRCGIRFEAVHAIDAHKPDCPACCGEVRQLILSAPAVHGRMARGRELAVRALAPQHVHGPGCGCGQVH